MDEIERRIAALNDRADRLADRFATIAKDGEGGGASGPTADGVHVPAPLGAQKKPKKKVVTDE